MPPDESDNADSGHLTGKFDIDSARIVGCWDMAQHLPPMIQGQFRTLVDYWVRLL